MRNGVNMYVKLYASAEMLGRARVTGEYHTHSVFASHRSLFRCTELVNSSLTYNAVNNLNL